MSASERSLSPEPSDSSRAFERHCKKATLPFVGMNNTSENSSDQELLQAFIEHSTHDALEILMKRHGRMVAGVAARQLVDKADQEDVFQATFVVLLKSANKIRKQASLASFLYGVAYRIASRMRTQNRTRTLPIASEVSGWQEKLIVDTSLSPADQSLLNESIAILEEELQKLPTTVLGPIVDHHLAGMTVPQIAHAMHLSVSAVEARIKRGKKALHQRLTKRGVRYHSTGALLSQLETVNHNPSWEQWIEPACETCTRIQSSSGSLPVEAVSPSLQQLVQGETVMRFSYRSLLIGLSVAAASATAIAWIPNIDPSSPVQAFQMGSPLMWGAPGETNPVPAAHDEKTAAREGGEQPAEPKRATVNWQPPSEVPKWLNSDTALLRQRQEEGVRSILRESHIQPAFKDEPLKNLSKVLEDHGLMVIFEKRYIEGEGITLDEPINLELPREISLYTLLGLVLKPLNLGYRIEGEIVFIADATQPANSVRFYDLSAILPDDSTLNEVVQVIETTVTSDVWENAGGLGTIVPFGSILIVKCPEESHDQIERLLQVLATQSRTNMKPRAPAPIPHWPGMRGGMFSISHPSP